MTARLGENGAFVLGPARCGSTMLSEILNLHPELLSISECLSVLGTRAFLPGKFSGADYWDLLSRSSSPLRKVFTPENAPREYLYHTVDGRFPLTNVPPLLTVTLPHLTNDPDALFDTLFQLVSGHPSQTLEEHHAALFEHLRELCGGRIWVERSGGSLRFARILPRMYPAAKFVFMHRDGRDVALSIQAFKALRPLIWSWVWSRWIGADPLDLDRPLARNRIFALQERFFAPIILTGWMVRTAPSLKTCADFWSAMTLRTISEIENLPAAQKHILHYENLVQDPRSSIVELMAFFGIKATSDWLDQAARIPKNSPPRWRQLAPGLQHDLTAWTEEARAAVDTLG